MTLETIIEAMDLLVEGIFVDHRRVRRHDSIKALWIYEIDVIYVDENRNRWPVIEHKSVLKSTIEEIDDNWEKVYKEFLPKLLDWLSSATFKTYRSDEFKQISDGIYRRRNKRTASGDTGTVL